MIRNIVFDMGQVICFYNESYIVSKLSIREENRETLRRVIFDSVEWVLMDAGFYDKDSLYEAVKEKLTEEEREDARIALSDWHYFMEPVEEMRRLIEEVRESANRNGRKLFVLSNANKQFPEYQGKIKAFEYMDGLYVSAFHGLIKPDLDIYRDFTREFSLDPAECLFIDDNKVNIAGAIMAGWEGIWYRGDVSLLREELKKRGLLS